MTSLETIRKAIIDDPDNAWAKEKGWEPVYTAHKEAKIVLIGQAPGIRAQESKTPWNDPSGDNLRSWLNVSREEFYDPTKFALVPMDFYFPGTGKGGDLPPRKGFAETWHPQIFEAMPQVKLHILIGAYAHEYYLGERRGKTLTETVKRYKEFLPEQLPLVHPSPRNRRWMKNNPWFEEEVIPQLRMRVEKELR